MLIEAKEARKKITYLWFLMGAVIFLIFIIQQLSGKFENKIADAWIWVSSNLLPSLGLVSGGYILDKRQKQNNVVDKSYYNLGFYTSLFYLFVMILVILTYPFSDKPILEYYKDSNMFLVPLQSIIGGFIGVFFIKGNGNNQEK